MTTQLDDVTQRLRETILAGVYAPDEKLREVAVAARLRVSRTLARLAFASLEKEGLLTREPNRGFRVRGFTIDDIAAAILVRGELEAMAARLAAERGLDAALAARFSACLDCAERLLRKATLSLEERVEWIEMNAQFHETLLEAAANETLSSTVRHVSQTPLASTRAIVFNQPLDAHGMAQLRASHADHRNLVASIAKREGGRAEAIAREHAYRSAANKRENFQAMKSRPLAPPLQGIALVNQNALTASPRRRSA